MRTGKVYIGTSGWHYKHWKGTFYPERLPDRDHLAHYVSVLSTVEVNNSFYKLPASSTFDLWPDAVPVNFRFAVKAPRFFTHMKKLSVDQTDINRFIGLTGHLGKKLGPILFQLPPRWKINLDRLASFLEKLPKGLRYTFEFRDPTWYVDETYRLLEKHHAAFCIYELDGHHSPMPVTARFIYIRLHGPGAKYQGNYTPVQLNSWKRKIDRWTSAGKDVYVYFDNDEKGYAAHNAMRLEEKLAKKRVTSK